jgi:hypothetical protein
MSEGRHHPGRGGSRALVALAGALALLATLAGPLIAAVVAATPAEYCCRRGRCCSAPQTTAETCVRAACGCGRSAALVPAAPLRPGVVVASFVAAPPPAATIAYPRAGARPCDLVRRPPLPPPRASLPSAATA